MNPPFNATCIPAYPEFSCPSSESSLSIWYFWYAQPPCPRHKCMISSSDLCLPESSSSSLVAARGHALLGKSSRGPSSDPCSVSALPPEVSLRRVGTTSPVRGWPRARWNCVSCPELASSEMEWHLPSDVGLGRDRTTSPA